MNNYLNIFIDEDYPYFINKYLNTKTLNRLKYITQFCGCDYTKLYNPLFLFTRFDHSLVVAHMTWHFTHDKKETIAALLHDTGTPCFAHCIDYVFGDYAKQESSEKDIIDIISQDQKLLAYLYEDNITLDELKNLEKYPILENKSPRLCTDRLDGVLHTCYIWLHTHSLEQIKEIYDDIIILNNEQGNKEIGFKSQIIAEKFVLMVSIYAKELQGNTDKYIMKYVSEMVKLAFKEKLISLNDLYIRKEEEIIDIFTNNFSSWETFNNTTFLTKTDDEPTNFFVSFDTKKRNTIPLVKTSNGQIRITDISDISKQIYFELEKYNDTKYAYIDDIKVCR